MPTSTPLMPPRYRVFLLRLWEERGQPPDSAAVWRLSLEDAQTGERVGFASLQALNEYLCSSIGLSVREIRYDPDPQGQE